ncbi:PspC domain-containing protein [Corynebacterium uberis]|uniref:PspC domain-containing protein n=1 Tax=Corynebacterium TaxID=1716 RepID=UPI001D0A71A4|nr:MULTISPECIES: PspC domain-containing protein [Corynebacterium]MCZ9309781.1 PspC domain-containing protein [Corynebacterium sp. c6VSa_13]UDL73583.1 PspC domain-containing protein [Corynebacterium uberis]UDL75537.1 PspC domain-containing protein [Corynebacterium uberis]UDL77750.1 PspC domain-containing protein [Corynebacterium uberis]UDL80033.1 PspC domain-containing protein [Corynebacterium uberis]
MSFAEDKWHRTDDGKRIAGICAGVAETCGLTANTVRVIYVMAALFGVPMVVVYLIQWIIYPKR